MNVGDIVSKNQVVCFADDVCRRYPNSAMQSHVHYEIINAQGEYVDPSLIDG